MFEVSMSLWVLTKTCNLFFFLTLEHLNSLKKLYLELFEVTLSNRNLSYCEGLKPFREEVLLI
jgi:hypothetical protein